MKPKACYVVFVFSVLLVLGEQSWSVSGGDNTVMATAKQFLLLYSRNFLKDVVGSTHRSLEIFSLTFFAFFPLYVGVNSSFMSETTSRKNDLLTLHGHVQ